MVRRTSVLIGAFAIAAALAPAAHAAPPRATETIKCKHLSRHSAHDVQGVGCSGAVGQALRVSPFKVVSGATGHTWICAKGTLKAHRLAAGGCRRI